MKKTILLSSIASAACIILTCSFLPSHPTTKNNPPEKKSGIAALVATETCVPVAPQYPEDVVTTSTYTVPTQAINTGATSIGLIIPQTPPTPTQTVVPLPNPAFLLTCNDITSLQYLAYGLVSGDPGNYVTVIQIEYGINSTFQNSLWVRPLLLPRATYTTNTGGKIVGTYTATVSEMQASNRFYNVPITGDINFSAPGPDNSVAEVGNYKKYLYLKHYSTDSSPSFNPLTDDTSVVYPIQELWAVINANLPTNPSYTYIYLIYDGILRANLNGTTPTKLMTQDIL
ncbi:MAG TPA: hypothetical protein VK808_05345, partial [Bacteroidia bacterium]|nr:hypothetical protein [Bacteroidia bacterium]